MPKRDREIDNEPANEELAEAEVPTVGDRLKAAREKSGLSLEDVAAQTRIPQRHLESIEAADWDKLPAPTYTVGFAKSYASAVGLDRSDIGDQLREEMGGQRFTSSQAEVFEPADPARTMPKWLVVSAIVAVIVLVVLMSWLNRRALDQPQPAAAEPPAATAPPAATVTPSRQVQAPAEPSAAAAQGPVTLTATAPAWVRVTDQGKTLFEATMQPGQTYQVPQTAVAPTLRAGAPEALRITVGNTVAPPVGPAGQVTSNVSLKGPDLMRGGASAGGQPGSPPPQ
ncbi:MAG TPA: helix-turn-helix domain-containing protein [Sphingomicrobium sp.]|jgi:cytoskeletal protein RodZ|nr:helix-turn-helix domain-containing protein [Sphingomicrobium sp.]